MAFDLITAKARVNAIGATQDPLIQAALKISVNLAERYCDRGLIKKREKERFYHVSANTLPLYRYPIEYGLSEFVVSGPVDAPVMNWIIGGTPQAPAAGLITAGRVMMPLTIDGDNGPVITGYHINNEIGQVLFDGRLIAHTLIVTYNGGYDPLPDDLELALWLIFDSVWAAQNPLSGGGASVAGTIESVTLADVGTVRFATGAAAAVSTGGALGGLLPAMASSLLDLYKRVLA